MTMPVRKKPRRETLPIPPLRSTSTAAAAIIAKKSTPIAMKTPVCKEEHWEESSSE